MYEGWKWKFIIKDKVLGGFIGGGEIYMFFGLGVFVIL